MRQQFSHPGPCQITGRTVTDMTDITQCHGEFHTQFQQEIKALCSLSEVRQSLQDNASGFPPNPSPSMRATRVCCQHTRSI